MNKAELITSVAEKTGMTKKNVELTVNAFVSTIEEVLVRRILNQVHHIDVGVTK